MSSTYTRTIDGHPDGVRAIIETALTSAAPNELVPGKIYAWARPDGQVQQVDLTGDQYKYTPSRKVGTTTVWDTAAFAAYYAKHADSATEVYADVQRLTITAVLDAHQADAPRWGKHRLNLALRKTPEWVAWLAMDGKLMDQEAFAEHLEDHLTAIVTPPAAQMLEIAQSLQATAKVDFQSSMRLSNGQRQLQYTETTTGKAGEKGKLEIPESFEIGLTPFEGSEPYKLSARFRYRINGSQLQMAYRLNQPEDTLRAAFGDVVETVRAHLDITVMNGSPA